MAMPLQQSKIVRISLLNEESILVEFSNGASTLIPTELMKHWVLQAKDSINWTNETE